MATGTCRKVLLKSVIEGRGSCEQKCISNRLCDVCQIPTNEETTLASESKKRFRSLSPSLSPFSVPISHALPAISDTYKDLRLSVDTWVRLSLDKCSLCGNANCKGKRGKCASWITATNNRCKEKYCWRCGGKAHRKCPLSPIPKGIVCFVCLRCGQACSLESDRAESCKRDKVKALLLLVLRVEHIYQRFFNSIGQTVGFPQPNQSDFHVRWNFCFQPISAATRTPMFCFISHWVLSLDCMPWSNKRRKALQQQ